MGASKQEDRVSREEKGHKGGNVGGWIKTKIRLRCS